MNGGLYLRELTVRDLPVLQQLLDADPLDAVVRTARFADDGSSSLPGGSR